MKGFKGVIALGLMVTLLFVLTGCSESGKPSAAVKELFEAFKAKDSVKMVDRIEDPEYTPFYTFMDMPASMGNPMIEKITDLKYEIVSETLDKSGKEADVEVKVSYYDIGSELSKGYVLVQTEKMSGSLQNATLEQEGDFTQKTYLANIKEAKRLDTTLKIHMKKFDKQGWKLIPRESEQEADPVYNVFTGNLVALVETMGTIESLNSEE